MHTVLVRYGERHTKYSQIQKCGVINSYPHCVVCHVRCVGASILLAYRFARFGVTNLVYAASPYRWNHYKKYIKCLWIHLLNHVLKRLDDFLVTSKFKTQLTVRKKCRSNTQTRYFRLSAISLSFTTLIFLSLSSLSDYFYLFIATFKTLL